MKSYTELDVWIEGRKLVSLIYSMTKTFPNEELYGMTNQIRRCSVSIPSNIAEGCGRQTPKETIHYLYISRGSLYELETQLYLAADLSYIGVDDLENVLSQIETTKKTVKWFHKLL
ncbi:four helix bundle protein [Snuella sedimenti]|uniref:Four helix bundle protein n=1 Tax=Snuella sedimenti TaxID=2798802 RepID=A0A8J7LLQ4_9FLAO|nr:four helix bundle protein [Snuella sedimenti]MBJ6366594.1 four helix bundle protein [Snuella sedimenti]